MTALLRAAGIPARQVYGKVLTESGPTGHEWNQVWIDGRWIHVDATWDLFWGHRYFDFQLSEPGVDHWDAHPRIRK